jgi:hypothetical protein
LLVLSLGPVVNLLRIGHRRVLQNRRVRGTGVFGINIDLPGEQAVVRNIAAEFEPADNIDALALKLLGKYLGEND